MTFKLAFGCPHLSKHIQKLGTDVSKILLLKSSFVCERENKEGKVESMPPDTPYIHLEPG